mmetsp:Transcript_29286/g.77388  ORF Transcript_29286/g.77388 Transcript_29286/m.77388 type:complete len:1025 (+) Transcript_29286:162-3236(+)
MAIIDYATSLLASLQAEIFIFLFAVIAHALFFGKYKLGGSAKDKLPKDPTLSPKAGRSKSERSVLSERSPKAVQAASHVVRALRPLLREDASAEVIAEKIGDHLEGLETDGVMEVLTGILESMGKSVTKEVLAAVRSILRGRSEQLSPAMAAWILRGYLSLRARAEFGEVLAQAEQQGPLSPGISMLAFRAAVAWGDLETALQRIKDLAPVWKATSASSPSAAPQQTLAQVARLATEKGALPTLLAELKGCGLIFGWTLEGVLSESVQSGNHALVKEIRELAKESGVELTSASYSALLLAEPAGAFGILAEAASKGAVGPDLLVAAANTAMASQDAKLAAAMVQLMTKCLTTDVAAHAIHLCGPHGPLANGDSDAAVLRIYAEKLQSADLIADTQAAKALTEAALRKGNHEEVLAKLCNVPGFCQDEMQQGPRRVALLNSLSPELRLAGAQAIFKATPEKSACLYNALINCCIQSRDLPSAEKAMAEATAEGMADVVTYNTIIKAHLQIGDAKRARACVDHMRNNAGLAPNVVTYNELIDALIKKDARAAWTLVDEMRAAGVQPNHVTCSIVLKSIQPGSRTSDVERALKLLDTMDDEMDEVLLSSVCEACIRVGRADLLTKQLQRQKSERGVQVQGAHTYGSIIRACGYVQDLEGVWSTWREMKRRHIVPTSITLGCMVEALVTNYEVEAGYELIREALADEVTHDLVNAVIFCSVLKGFSHAKRYDRVWSVHEEMLAHKLQFSIVTFNTLIDACARSCEMGRIPALLEEMSKQGIEPNVITYSTVLKGYCTEHRLDKAFEVLDDMKKSKKFMPDEVTYNTLLDGCARHGLYDRGMSVLDDMLESGVVPSNFTLSVLVKLANRSHQPEKAFLIVKDLCEKYNLRPNSHVYSNLVHACTAHGDLRKGMEVLEQMLGEHIRPDSRTYALLARACLEKREVNDAVGLLRGALGLHGAHARIAKFSASLVMPRGGLDSALVSEILEAVAGVSDTTAVQLLRDLRQVQGLKLDPRLMNRLTAKAIHTR